MGMRTKFKPGCVISGPNYSGQDDQCQYVIIGVLGPGQRLLFVDDERDHNRVKDMPEDDNYGYLCINLSDERDIESQTHGSHRPSKIKVWRDHPNLKLHSSKLDVARGVVAAASYSRSLKDMIENHTRELELGKSLLGYLESAGF